MKTSVIDSFAQFHIIYINLIKSNDVKVKKTSFFVFSKLQFKKIRDRSLGDKQILS